MKTVLNVKIDKAVKKKTQQVAKEIGLPLSTIVTGLLNEFIVAKEIRFSAPYRMSAKLERKLARVEKDIKANKNISGPFNSDKEMLDYLHSLK